MSLLAAFFIFTAVAMLVGGPLLRDRELEEKYRTLRADYNKAVQIMCDYLGYAQTDKPASVLAQEVCHDGRKK